MAFAGGLLLGTALSGLALAPWLYRGRAVRYAPDGVPYYDDGYNNWQVAPVPRNWYWRHGGWHRGWGGLHGSYVARGLRHGRRGWYRGRGWYA